MTNKLQNADVRQVWPIVRAGLLKVAEKTKPDWTLEEVYARVRNDKATLLMAPEGFVIVYAATNDSTLEKFLLVWIAYGEGGNLIETYQSQLETLARQIGCTALEFHSPRKGFEKLDDWRVQRVVYRKELT